MATGEFGDRMDRAGRYVLGLMDDEERERAERDLEIDPAFRAAMVEIAERMHVFDRMPAPEQAVGQPAGVARRDYWPLIKEKIQAMPQMRETPSSVEPTPPESMPSGPPAAFGRRRSDRMGGQIVPEKPAKTVGIGLHAMPGHRALVLALCLIAAFVLGYVAGRL
ncbi:MAG TPA: hypothetical protein VIZ90_04025 [Rhizobiaceae bacterium]